LRKSPSLVHQVLQHRRLERPREEESLDAIASMRFEKIELPARSATTGLQRGHNLDRESREDRGQ